MVTRRVALLLMQHHKNKIVFILPTREIITNGYCNEKFAFVPRIKACCSKKSVFNLTQVLPLTFGDTHQPTAHTVRVYHTATTNYAQKSILP